MWTIGEMCCLSSTVSDGVMGTLHRIVPWSKESITSTGVNIFFSLILSYFCFFVPAFRPCHGRLGNSKMKKENLKSAQIKLQEIIEEKLYLTFLLRNTSAHNQEIQDHPSHFILYWNQERLSHIHISRLADLWMNISIQLQLSDFNFKVDYSVLGIGEFKSSQNIFFPIPSGP